jgi:ribosomal protein S18 acetylase RimI-like enzyme
MDLVIRRAEPRDKRGVRDAVRTLWNGHDRVPRLFDEWVTHRGGPFFVAESRGRIVGMGRLTTLSPREAWLEGGRVAPRYRRRGIATALVAHRLVEAKEQGFKVVRFSTASDNVPMHRIARQFGFRRARSFELFTAEATRDGEPARRATRSSAARIRRLAGPYIQVPAGWEWRSLMAADARRAIARGRAVVVPSAAAIISGARDDSLPVIAIGGSVAGMATLLRALRVEASRRGVSEVDVYLADSTQRRVARAAGYRRPWTGAAYLFEKVF